MTIKRFDPFNDLEGFNRVMDRWLTNRDLPSTTTRGIMPVDIFEKNGSLIINAAIPGVDKDEINVNVEDNVLTIEAESRESEEISEAKVYRREFSYGKMTRSMRLPEDLDFDSISASYENGFLTIRIPRVEQPKPTARRIPIEGAKQSAISTESRPAKGSSKNKS